MIVKTDAIVLQVRRYGESSKIVTLFTREHGKFGVMARGAMQPKSKFGSSLQPMSVVSATVYFKEGRDLQTLSDAENIVRLGSMSTNLDAMSAGFSIVELVNAVMHDHQPNESVFELVTEALEQLSRESVPPELVLIWFSINLSAHIGYAVNPEQCAVCGEPVPVGNNSVPFSLPDGAPLCQEHGTGIGSDRSLSPAAFDLLKQICQMQKIQESANISKKDACNELVTMLQAFLQFHVQGLRRLKAGNITSQL